jgi:hypothetical protein
VPGRAPLAQGNRAVPLQGRVRAGTWRLAMVLGFAVGGSVLGLVLVLIARRL